MLFKRETLDRIRSGDVTLAFRRWRRPTVKAGGRLRTPIGELAIDDVSRVALDTISDDDARRAGHASRAGLLAELGRREGEPYRIAFRLAGPDPRIARRENDRLGEAELADIVARLTRLDRASAREWTERILRLIKAHPERRAGDLAAMCGLETVPFKRRVRQLKELGLTESREVGYRLSPLGRRVLAHLGTAGRLA